jgi:hypothetical protein
MLRIIALPGFSTTLLISSSPLGCVVTISLAAL